MKKTGLPKFRSTALTALLGLTLLLLGSCGDDMPERGTPQLVVDGWIDDGGFPVVLLTTSLPVTTQGENIEEAWRFVVGTASVTVSDGEREVALTARVDRRYYPPFVYTTGELRGQAGRSYRLHVEWEGGEAEATTTLPATMPPANMEIKKCAESDTLYELTASFHNPPGEHRYYKAFTRPADERSYYRSAFMGTYDGSLLSEDARIAIFRGHDVSLRNFTPYFVSGERILVKLCAIDRPAFDFWKSYEDMVSLSRNPLFPVTVNLRGNVRGALGYWCGYGAREYYVAVPSANR